jgi:hypothetical protein
MTSTFEVDAAKLRDFDADAALEQKRIQLCSTWMKSVYHATEGRVELPYSATTHRQWITVYNPWPKKLVEKSWAPGEYHWIDDRSAARVINVDETNKQISRILKHAASLGFNVEKKYDDSDVHYIVMLEKNDGDSYNSITFEYIASRQSVCTKVVTGYEDVPEEVIPAHKKETTEWVCEKVSFLGMDTD